MASFPAMPAAPPVDFALFTALEEEQAALLAHVPGARALEKAEGDVATVHAAEIPTTRADGAVYRVIFANLGMGPVAAAVRAASLARRFRPRHVLLVGIAGGVSGEVELGDVLVASRIADYTVGKISPEGRKVDWRVFPADPGLVDSAEQLSTGWQERLRAPRPSPGEPRRRIGVVASGGDVIATSTRIAELRGVFPKLIGVEMEGAGVAAALAEVPTPPAFLMIRGVSDFADEAKSTAAIRVYRAFACDVAAVYAIALLKRGPAPALAHVGGQAPRHDDGGSLERRILSRLQEGFSLPELEMFIRSSFPEIPGGLSGIVSPVHDFRYQTFKVVEHFKRRRDLARLHAALDEALGPVREDER